MQLPQLTGPCQLTDGGACATSPNYPRNYDINQQCIISNVPASQLEVIHFDVQPDDYSYDADGKDGGSCDFDYLKVDGVRYCGTSGPAGVVAESGIILWVSNNGQIGPLPRISTGWKARALPAFPARSAPRLTCAGRT